MPHLQFLVKPVSSLCNIECEYCFYHDLAGHQHAAPRKMELSVISSLMDRAAEFFIESSASTSRIPSAHSSENSVSFLFQGGEPTLAGLNFFKAVVQEQQRAFARVGWPIPVFNSIQTNACHLNEELVAFLAANHFLFGVSLDGPSHVHDAYRIYRNGRGSFSDVMKGIDLLRRFNAEFNILCVVTDITAAHTADVYNFFKSNGFFNLQFIACLDRFAKTPAHPCSTNPQPSAIPFLTIKPDHQSNVSSSEHSLNVTAHGVMQQHAHTEAVPKDGGKPFLSNQAYGKFLVDIFDLFYDDLISRGVYVSIRHIENYLAMLLNMHINACNMTGVCSIQNVIEASGNVYPCDFYAHDDFLLGNIHSSTIAELMNCQRARQFVEHSTKLSNECRNCSYFKLCRGGCVRERAQNTNIHCSAFKHFFGKRLQQLQHAAAILMRSTS